MVDRKLFDSTTFDATMQKWGDPRYTIKTDLASTASGKGSELVGFLQSGTGAVATTVSSKLQGQVNVFDFMTSAQKTAVKTGINIDVSAAVQAAIDAYKPTSVSVPSGGVIMHWPAGRYYINAPINTYSGILHIGSGSSTVLVAGPGVASGGILQLAAFGSPSQYRYAGIRDMAFESSGTTWSILATASNVLNCEFRNLTFTSTYCIKAATYTQDCVFRRILSIGSVERILWLVGQFNEVDRLDKESGTGTSTEPYLHLDGTLGPSNENVFTNILLEGAGSSNKTPFKIDTAESVHIDTYHMEASVTNGFALTIVNSSVSLRGIMSLSVRAHGAISISTNSIVRIDEFNAAGEDFPWQSFFTIDSTSDCQIKRVLTRRSADDYRLGFSNLRADEVYNQTQTTSPVAGMSDIKKPNFSGGQNLAINPSFEAGLYGWTFSGTFTLTEFIASEVGAGLMLHGQSSTGGQLTQSTGITVTAGQVSAQTPFTIRFLAKCSGGFIVPIVLGSANTGTDRISAGNGWETITITFIPQAAGTVNIGLWWVGVSGTQDIWVDDFTACWGDSALINPAKFGSVELATKTFTVASAAPTTGTWKVGDRVFNSVPAVGQPKSWVCTVAGSPGTWVSEGNL